MKLLFFFSLVVASRAAVQFSRSDMGSNGFKESVIEFKDRIYVPYGPDRTTNPPQDPANQPWTGYGYGLGATEHWAYDSKEKYIYSQSEFGGYITIIDYAELPGTVTDVSLDVGGDNVEVRDIVVCSEQGLLFVTVTDRNTVLMYETVKRDDPQVPLLIESIAAGNSPDAMKLSNDCAILAVANQNEGRSILSQGAVTLVTNFRSSQGSTVTSVLLTGFTDEDLLERNVNMPLTRQAMQYWTQELELGWDGPDGLIEQYNPAIALDPEFLAFSADGSTLYLNLQDNSALVRIDTATGQARAVDGYGLKKIAVDIVKDGECQLVSDDCLFLGRTPDGIASVEYEGTDYVFTADEGSGFDLDDYEEEYDSNDVFGPGGAIQLSGFVVSETVASCAAHFADGCNETWCSNFEMSVGTLAVDYSDPTTPIMNNIVGFGGRGVSLFRIPDSFDDPITFVWDSGSTFEEETCANFPWAHNSVMDEDFAPVGGPRWILNVEDREGIEELNDVNRDGCTLSDGKVGKHQKASMDSRFLSSDEILFLYPILLQAPLAHALSRTRSTKRPSPMVWLLKLSLLALPVIIWSCWRAERTMPCAFSTTLRKLKAPSSSRRSI